MSIKEPKKNTPTPKGPEEISIPALGTSVEELSTEYKKLDAMLGAINGRIEEENQKVVAAQEQIVALRNQGLQVVGQANVLARQLSGMGIDARKLGATPAPPAVNSPNFSPSEAENEVEVSEPEEFNPVSSIKNRFARR